jgi:hypothetical protein
MRHVTVHKVNGEAHLIRKRMARVVVAAVRSFGGTPDGS